MKLSKQLVSMMGILDKISEMIKIHILYFRSSNKLI